MASARSLPPSLKIVTVAFLVLWLIIAAFPFLWTVWGSFKVQADFFSRESFWNAIWGTATTAQTGGPFTGARRGPAPERISQHPISMVRRRPYDVSTRAPMM